MPHHNKPKAIENARGPTTTTQTDAMADYVVRVESIVAGRVHYYLVADLIDPSIDSPSTFGKVSWGMLLNFLRDDLNFNSGRDYLCFEDESLILKGRHLHGAIACAFSGQKQYADFQIKQVMPTYTGRKPAPRAEQPNLI